MTKRIDFWQLAPEGLQALKSLESYLQSCSIELPLLELVKMRASQINGCAFCMDMHSRDALAAGENAQRLYLLSAWRETELFTPRECAALEWTEAVTRIADGSVDDHLRARVRQHYSELELVDLTLIIVAINAWNRLAVPFSAAIERQA